jgi:4-hydroxy-2-oxoheptanedioate aldolase
VTRLHDRLRAGQLALGGWLSLASSGAAEILGQAGFDWVLIDQQHSALGPAEMLDLVRTVGATPASPVVRIPANSPEYFAHALDAGAHAVMVPLIEGRASAEAAVRAFRYPPTGMRSIGGYRSHLAFGMPRADYLAAAPALLILQLEHRRAIENVHDIASVPGVDILFVGPQDLSASYGLTPTLRLADRVIEQALTAVTAAGRGSGVNLGILCADAEDARDCVSRGFRMVAVGTDASMLTAAGKAMIEAVAVPDPMPPA